MERKRRKEKKEGKEVKAIAYGKLPCGALLCDIDINFFSANCAECESKTLCIELAKKMTLLDKNAYKLLSDDEKKIVDEKIKHIDLYTPLVCGVGVDDVDGRFYYDFCAWCKHLRACFIIAKEIYKYRDDLCKFY